MGGSDVSADTVGYVYLDIDICGAMYATMSLEIIAAIQKSTKTRGMPMLRWRPPAAES